MSSKRKIFIFSDSTKTKGVHSLTKEANKRGFDVDVVSPSTLMPMTSNSINGYDRLYNVNKGEFVKIRPTDYEYVICRIGRNLRYGAMVVDHLRYNIGIFTSATGEALLAASNKFESIQRFSAYGLPAPKTILAPRSEAINAKAIISQLGSEKVVIKQLGGSKGAGVAIVDSPISLQSNLESYQKANVPVMLQQYIEAGGKDVRAFVVGNKVVASYERSSPKSDFRANMSLGGTGIPVELDMELQVMCVKAARAVGLDIAGVDLIKDKDGEWYLVEVNGNAGFRIIDVTGINVSAHILDFMEQAATDFKKEKARLYDQKAQLDGVISALIEENRKLWYFQKPIKDNEYLEELRKKTFGYEVNYEDRYGVRKKKLIRTMRDILTIMSETFNIQ